MATPVKLSTRTVIELTVFLAWAIALPAVTALALARLKEQLYSSTADAAYNPVAGWGLLFLPLLAIGIATSTPVVGFLRRWYYPDGQRELLTALGLKIVAIVVLPFAVLLGLFVDSYVRIDDTGIEHNRIFLDTVRLPWRSLQKAELTLVSRSLGKGSRRVALPSLTVTFPGSQLELYDYEGSWYENVAKLSRIVDTVNRQAPGRLVVVPPPDDVQHLLDYLEPELRRTLDDIFLRATSDAASTPAP